MLDERVILLGLQETDLGVRDAILAEELECSRCHPKGHDLLVELDELAHGCTGLSVIEPLRVGGCRGESYG
jgi:hypothetical protein